MIGARSLLFAGAVACLACADTHGDDSSKSPLPSTSRDTFTTVFAQTENPISDNGRWVNGAALGSDWSDVSSAGGHAIGHQTGASYTDATALLTGTWGPDQHAQATVFASEKLDDLCYSEVELRLRSAMSPHQNRGYEVAFKVSKTATAYLIVVRWNGKLGDFTYLTRKDGSAFGVADGDVVEAAIVGQTITVFKNGVKLVEVVDRTFHDGSPGIGFNLENARAGCAGTNDRYGFSRFRAWD